MKRIVIALAAAAAVSLAGIAPAASADPAPQPITVTGPGASVKTPYPVFSWIAPAGENFVNLYVTTKPTVGADGKLPNTGKTAVTYEALADGATAFVDKKFAYSPGTYYWQVAAFDSTYSQYLSPVQKFTVPLVVKLSKEKTKLGHMQYNGQRAIFGAATLTCNYPQDQYYSYFYMDVYKGKKRLASSLSQHGDCVGMRPVRAEAVWAPPASLKSGTKLTIKLYLQSKYDSTVKYGGANIPKNKSAVSTLKITWRK